MYYTGFYYGWETVSIEAHSFKFLNYDLSIIKTTAYADETSDSMKFYVKENILPKEIILEGRHRCHFEFIPQDDSGIVFYSKPSSEIRDSFATHDNLIFEFASFGLNDFNGFQEYIQRKIGTQHKVRFKIIIDEL